MNWSCTTSAEGTPRLSRAAKRLSGRVVIASSTTDDTMRVDRTRMEMKETHPPLRTTGPRPAMGSLSMRGLKTPTSKMKGSAAADLLATAWTGRPERAVKTKG